MSVFSNADSLGALPSEEMYVEEILDKEEYPQTGFLNNDFRTCLARLIHKGMDICPRGQITKELLNYNITLRNPRNRIITLPERKINTRYLLGEFIWYLSASNDPKGILPYSKFWANITNSGKQIGYKEGTVNSNYGNRLFGNSSLLAFPSTEKSQWAATIELLKKDKDTRQAILNIHVPSDRHEGNRDVCCTLSLQFLIRENALHLIVNMRSQDVILGFGNDVFQFTMLQECMQVMLKDDYPDLQLGHYFHNTGSMHVYSKHFSMAEAIAIKPANKAELEMIPMDRFSPEIVDGLINCEQAWISDGMKDDFAFNDVPAWKNLTPYWQILITALFLRNEHALEFMFGQMKLHMDDDALTLDEARRIYDRSHSRLDLAALDQMFATAPDSVEAAGKNLKS